MARGTYYRQHHDDDLMEPGCIEACVELLERTPEAVLAHTHTRTIDENGTVIFGNEPVDYKLDDPKPYVRFEKYMRQVFPHPPKNALLNICFSLIRRAVLESTSLEGEYPHADRMMYGGLSLYGTFAVVPEPLFRRRDHADRATRKLTDEKVLARWQATSNRDRLLFMPRTEALADILSWVLGAPISFGEKMRCLLVIRRHYLRHFGVNVFHYEPRRETSRLVKGGIRSVLRKVPY